MTVGSIKDDETLPILMPLWKRLERLPSLVEQLNAQTDMRFDLVLWLNGATEDRRKAVYEATSELSPAIHRTIRTSEENFGGWARYCAFREAYSLTTYPRYAVLVDDDVDLEPRFITWARTRTDEKTMWGRHGFRFCAPDSSYWNRREAGQDLASPDAHMVSTQSTVLDTRVLMGHEILDVAAGTVMGMEDLWLCYVATVFYGYRIRACRTPSRVVADGKDVWPTIRQNKNEFLQELRGRGWKV